MFAQVNSPPPDVPPGVAPGLLPEAWPAQNADFYRAILDTIQEGIYFVDLDRRIVFWNRGAEQLTGYLSQEVIGRQCQDNILLHADEHGNVLCHRGCPLAATAADGKPRKTILFVRHKEGHRIPVWVAARPLFSPAGEIAGAVEVFSYQPVSLLSPQLATPDNLAAEPRAEWYENPESLEIRAERTLLALRQRGRPTGLLYLEIDNFRRLDYRYGRDAERKTIQVVSKTLCLSLRAEDAGGLWRPGAFLLLFETDNLNSLVRAADRLKNLIGATCFPWWENTVLITASVGATLLQPMDTMASAVSRAQQLAAAAAGQGGNRVAADRPRRERGVG